MRGTAREEPGLSLEAFEGQDPEEGGTSQETEEGQERTRRQCLRSQMGNMDPAGGKQLCQTFLILVSTKKQKFGPSGVA